VMRRGALRSIVEPPLFLSPDNRMRDSEDLLDKHPTPNFKSGRMSANCRAVIT